MSLGTLALIGICGLCGPLLSASTQGAFPAVVGEILAGVIVGQAGLRLVDTANPTLSFLSDVGFAMLMLNAGMNVPLRSRQVLASLDVGIRGAVVVGAGAVGAGFLVSLIGGVGHPAVYAVLLGSGSAAVVLPVIQERRLGGDAVLTVIAQVTVADVAATVAIPFVMRPDQAGRVAGGTALIAACVTATFVVVRSVSGSTAIRSVRRQGKRRRWALDLRLALIVLFGLGWIAQRSGASLLIAGFGAGLMVAGIGGPKRLSTEVLGVAGGLFVPLFFVVLGARIDPRGVIQHPAMIGFALGLAALTIAVHVLGARITRQPLAAGLLASAQMGVPSAIVTLGLSTGVITPTQGAAIIAAALISLAVCAAGAALLTAGQRQERLSSSPQNPFGAARLAPGKATYRLGGMSSITPTPFRVLIVGGGVAGLEAALALRELAGERIHTTLLSQAPQFVYRPMRVTEPFAGGAARHYSLEEITRDIGVELTLDTFEWLDPNHRVVHTERGELLPYDALLLAPGAVLRPRFKHALTLNDALLDEQLHGLIQDVEGGYIHKLAFLAPSPMPWPLPLYELALMTARRAYDMNIDLSITIATPEETPLGVFGTQVSDAVARLLEENGILVLTSARAETPEAGQVSVHPGARQLYVDRVVALPQLFGPDLSGVPTGSAGGFIPVDVHCRVRTLDRVYAAGDATDFAVKHGGVAALQADAAAEQIAALAGAPVEPKPFQPVIHGVLLGGAKPLYLSAHVTGGHGSSSEVSETPTWSPASKIAAKYLAPYLESRDRAALR